MSKRLSKKLISQYKTLLCKRGEDGIFKRAVAEGILFSSKVKNPDLGVLEISESFLALYRREGIEEYAAISRALRRAAHAINRELLRQDEARRPNHRKFITLVA